MPYPMITSTTMRIGKGLKPRQKVAQRSNMPEWMEDPQMAAAFMGGLAKARQEQQERQQGQQRYQTEQDWRQKQAEEGQRRYQTQQQQYGQQTEESQRRYEEGRGFQEQQAATAEKWKGYEKEYREGALMRELESESALSQARTQRTIAEDERKYQLGLQREEKERARKDELMDQYEGKVKKYTEMVAANEMTEAQKQRKLATYRKDWGIEEEKPEKPPTPTVVNALVAQKLILLESEIKSRTAERDAALSGADPDEINTATRKLVDAIGRYNQAKAQAYQTYGVDVMGAQPPSPSAPTPPPQPNAPQQVQLNPAQRATVEKLRPKAKAGDKQAQEFLTQLGETW